MLNQTDLSLYQKQGYLLLPDFVSADECRTMREQAAHIVDAFDPASDPRCLWDGGTQRKHVSFSYFIESLNKVSVFFEAATMKDDGQMLCDKAKAAVKIGHALHDYDPVFKLYSHSRRMNELAQDLGYKKPLIGQSRYFFKLPKVKGSIAPHQDSTALYTEPLSCYAVWLALEDATIENGCVWIIPGSHHNGLLRRVLREPKTGASRIVEFNKTPEWDSSLFVPLEVKAGTAVLMQGEVIHQSKTNTSEISRQAYAVHFIEGADTHKYPTDNWLQRPGGFRELIQSTEYL